MDVGDEQCNSPSSNPHKKTIWVSVQAVSDHEQRNVFLSMTTGEGTHGLDQDCGELNSGSSYISAIKDAA
jgi:hypothetical protein